jgi:hypothetical protein
MEAFWYNIDSTLFTSWSLGVGRSHNMKNYSFKCLTYRQFSTNFMVVTAILSAHTAFLWATCCLICFITIVIPLLTLIMTTVHTVFLIWKGACGGCVWSTGDSYSSIAPGPTSDIFRGPCMPILWFVFPIGLMRLNIVRYFVISFTCLYRKKSSSPELEGQIQLNLAKIILG